MVATCYGRGVHEKLKVSNIKDKEIKEKYSFKIQNITGTLMLDESEI